MNSALIALKKLQETDDALRALAGARELAAAQESGAKARLCALEAKGAALNEALAEMHRRHRELEAEVKDTEARRNNNQKRQGAVKTEGEFKALAKEAEYLAGRISGTEDEILDILDKIEKAEAEKADLAAVLTEEAEKYAKTAAESEAAARAGSEGEAGLGAARKAILAALPPANLRQYEEIARARAGRAVSAALSGLCQACGLGFPPQLFNELQRNESIKTCPNCGRILYWRDHSDFN